MGQSSEFNSRNFRFKHWLSNSTVWSLMGDSVSFDPTGWMAFIWMIDWVRLNCHLVDPNCHWKWHPCGLTYSNPNQSLKKPKNMPGYSLPELCQYPQGARFLSSICIIILLIFFFFLAKNSFSSLKACFWKCLLIF